VRVDGLHLQADGYLVDFGDLKSAVRAACKRLDHRTLIPTRSEVFAVRARFASGPRQV
jgi:6-pyruvoyl-tetrahydropterin synthase